MVTVDLTKTLNTIPGPHYIVSYYSTIGMYLTAKMIACRYRLNASRQEVLQKICLVTWLLQKKSKWHCHSSFQVNCFTFQNVNDWAFITVLLLSEEPLLKFYWFNKNVNHNQNNGFHNQKRFWTELDTKFNFVLPISDNIYLLYSSIWKFCRKISLRLATCLSKMVFPWAIPNLKFHFTLFDFFSF